MTTLNILYGTQTGNAEFVADEAAEAAKAKGFEIETHELNDVDMATLSSMERAIVVCSTYGEGEPPDNAELFWEALSAPDAPRLETLKFGVVALGDTGYDTFCEAGKQIDKRLEELGASRVADRVDCDIDFEEPSEKWIANALTQFQS
ncbi:MAG: flavodoxin domain-containing protein [Pseudomonadota bacterium]